MYVDHYERLLHKPIERKAPPTPTVPYARVGRHPPIAEPPKRKPGQGASRQAWPHIAELYAAHPTKPLSFIARKLRMHHTSIYYALTTMGLYVKRAKPADIEKRLCFRAIPGHISTKQQARNRKAALLAAGKHWNGSAKLDAKTVRAMRHMAAEGVSRQHIARTFHTKYATANAAIRGTTWGHVE